MSLLKLAWRNIGRNRRRTIITIASVFFAVFFCVIMMSLQTGVWDRMIENTLKTQTGHIQIHAKDYWDDKIIDNFMFMDTTTIAELENISDIENVSPRVEIFAMSSFGTVSKGVAIIGVSPAKEAQKSNLPSRIKQGEYLSETDDGILIGEGLSKYLKINLGDTIALIGQGYHGSSAAGLFPLRGILNMLTPEMDNGLAYMTLASTQQFIDMPDGYSGILISVKNNNRMDEVIRKVEQTVDTQTLDVYPWHFTMERLLQTAESDKAFNFIVMYILYLIVGFGIFGTIIMMTNERRREFCVMISLGMRRLRLATVIAIELIIISLIGVTLAFVVTLPMLHWFDAHPIKLTGEMYDLYLKYGMEPIMPMSINPSIFTEQIVAILVIVLLAVIYPVNKILKLKITNK